MRPLEKLTGGGPMECVTWKLYRGFPIEEFPWRGSAGWNSLEALHWTESSGQCPLEWVQ
jgi:hypothetical protein